MNKREAEKPTSLRGGFLVSRLSKTHVILNASHLIPIKARAHIDLADRKKKGENIDDRDIRKHKNDIFRLFQLLSPDTRINLPSPIHNDFKIFLNGMKMSFPVDCKSLGLKNMNADKVIENLEEIYIKNFD